MKDKKRVSIRRKVQKMVMAISTTALVLTSVVGIVSMILIRSQAQDIFIARMENNLTNIVTNKAELADAEFSRYTSYADSFAQYIHEMYVHPDQFARCDVKPPSAKDVDTYCMKRYLASTDVHYEDVEEEIKLLGNVEQVFRPVVDSNGPEILAIYVSTETGIQISYDKDSKLTAREGGGEVYYNYFERPWYTLGKTSDKATFTNVYDDSYDRGLMVSCVAPFYDENDEFRGVVCIDMLIERVYDLLVDFDFFDGNDDYAFIIDGNGYAIAPAYRRLNITNDSSMEDILKSRIMSGETGVSYSQSGCYYAYSPIGSVNWKLCLHVPERMIQDPVNDMSKKIFNTVLVFLLIFIGIAIITLVVVRKFAKSLTKPLVELRKDAGEISSGNLDHVAKVYSNDEIGDLAISFNNMAISLKDYINNLTLVTAEKERIGAELGVATQIQADMLPRNFPPFPEKKEFDLYAIMDPAKEVGGDFYDFFLIDEDHICLVMADVSGKGVPAALFMVIAKTLIKNRATMGGSPSEILTYVNEQLCEGNEAELFVTVWIAIIEISTGKGIAANAGHEHPVICRAGGDYELVIYKHSMAVAAMEGVRFREHEFELKPGDKLYVYTDGVPEATDKDNQLYGTDRMLKCLNDNKEEPVEGILKAVRGDIDNFVGEAPQFDDITMLSFYYKG